MLYMVREGFAERAEAFVANGGHLVTTYWTGVVDETDLVIWAVSTPAAQASGHLGGRDRVPGEGNAT